jgi:hypothetical protein
MPCLAIFQSVIGKYSEKSIALHASVFCERVLSEIASASSASDQGAHDRYLKVFEIVRDKDNELGALFDNPRRSSALGQLCMIASAEELSRFSPETRNLISAFAAKRI